MAVRPLRNLKKSRADAKAWAAPSYYLADGTHRTPLADGVYWDHRLRVDLQNDEAEATDCIVVDADARLIDEERARWIGWMHGTLVFVEGMGGSTEQILETSANCDAERDLLLPPGNAVARAYAEGRAIGCAGGDPYAT